MYEIHKLCLKWCDNSKFSCWMKLLGYQVRVRIVFSIISTRRLNSLKDLSPVKCLFIKLPLSMWNLLNSDFQELLLRMSPMFSNRFYYTKALSTYYFLTLITLATKLSCHPLLDHSKVTLNRRSCFTFYECRFLCDCQ